MNLANASNPTLKTKLPFNQNTTNITGSFPAVFTYTDPSQHVICMLRSTRKRNFEDMQHSEVGEEFIRAPSYDSVCVFVCVCVCVCAGGWCFTSLRILRWEHIAVFLIHFLQIIFSFPIRMLEVCWVLGEQRLHKSLIWLGLLFRTGCHWKR